MSIKRILAIILSFLMIFSLYACQGNKEENTVWETSTDNSGEELSDNASDKILTSTATTDIVLATSVSNDADSNSASSDASVNTFNNPADWSTAQIVDVYKTAAKKSNDNVKSEQSIALKSISVNNGEYEGVFEFITPIMSKLLANNSTEKDGITGGYNDLVASDIAFARAYKSGNNIAVEMILNEQVSGAREDALKGSVGHAITAVGDITVVTKQLKDLGLPLEISEKDTKIYYTNPKVKVLINSNGEIINGTWSYTVEINLNNYKAFGKTVDTTSVIMDNTITLNGGF